MIRNRIAAATLVLMTLFMCAGAGQAQEAAPSVKPASAIQFPQLPLKRDEQQGAAGLSLAWTALVVIALLGAGVVLARRGLLFGSSAGAGWLRGATGVQSPRSVRRVTLTPQASLHVVEWHGEELLVGCTPQSVTMLARRPAGGPEDPSLKEVS